MITKDQLEAIARSIAKQLGSPWSYDEERSKGYQFPHVYLGTGKHGLCLEQWQSPGMIRIYGTYPFRKDPESGWGGSIDSSMPGDPNPEMRCNEKKRPDQIAVEIERRILPGYFKRFEEALIFNQELEEGWAAKRDLIKHLGNILGEKPYNEGDSLTAFDSETSSSARLKINSATSVEMDLRYLPISTVIKITELLAKDIFRKGTVSKGR